MSEITPMDVIEIKKWLPHRYPFLLVDRVTELVMGEYIKAYKNITNNEAVFNGHFPQANDEPRVLHPLVQCDDESCFLPTDDIHGESGLVRAAHQLDDESAIDATDVQHDEHGRLFCPGACSWKPGWSLKSGEFGSLTVRRVSTIN